MPRSGLLLLLAGSFVMDICFCIGHAVFQAEGLRALYPGLMTVILFIQQRQEYCSATPKGPGTRE